MTSKDCIRAIEHHEGIAQLGLTKRLIGDVNTASFILLADDGGGTKSRHRILGKFDLEVAQDHAWTQYLGRTVDDGRPCTQVYLRLHAMQQGCWTLQAIEGCVKVDHAVTMLHEWAAHQNRSESASLLAGVSSGKRHAMQEGRLLNEGVRRRRLLQKRAQRRAVAANPAAKTTSAARQTAPAQAPPSNFEVPLDIYCIKLVISPYTGSRLTGYLMMPAASIVTLHRLLRHSNGLDVSAGGDSPCQALLFCLTTCMSSGVLQVPIGNLDQYLDELIRDQKQRMQVILPADLSWPICMALQSPMIRMQAKC